MKICRNEDYDYENFISKTFKINSFSNHMNTIATSILFDRPIYLYQVFKKKNRKDDLYNYSKKENNFNPILVAFSHTYMHYEPIFMHQVSVIPVPAQVHDLYQKYLC